MKTGMMWYDDDPSTTLEKKVVRAARHYKRKHGRRPDTCLVHRSVFADKKQESLQVGDIRVGVGHSVLAHHFWMGCEDIATVQVQR